jgi:hypothetical protein
MTAWRLEYTIDVDEENAVIRAKIYGLWKGETAEAYHRDFEEQIEPLLGKPWAKVINLAGWKTSYESVVDTIGKHMSWSKDNDASLQLYVLDNPSTFRQLNQMIKKGKAEDITHIFRTEDEAEQFLKENWIGKRKKKRV